MIIKQGGFCKPTWNRDAFVNEFPEFLCGTGRGLERQKVPVRGQGPFVIKMK